MNLAHYRPNCLTTNPRKTASLFDDLFDDFFAPFSFVADKYSAKNALQLRVDIYEKEEKIYIDAELPGIEKEDIAVDVKGKLITIGAERKNEDEVKDENNYRRERSYGKFERTFSLPFEIDESNVSGNFTNGLLRLEISKPAEQATKKITIN